MKNNLRSSTHDKKYSNLIGVSYLLIIEKTLTVKLILFRRSQNKNANAIPPIMT